MRRLSSLESAVTEANKFAEAEAVRCEQSEAVTESLLTRSKMHGKLLAQHSQVRGTSSSSSTSQCTPHEAGTVVSRGMTGAAAALEELSVSGVLKAGLEFLAAFTVPKAASNANPL